MAGYKLSLIISKFLTSQQFEYYTVGLSTETGFLQSIQLCHFATVTGDTCIAPPTGRPTTHHRVDPYPGARRQNETETFSDHDETSPSIAAVSAPLAACSMLVVQQQNNQDAKQALILHS